jgi:hypothetical protein
VYQLSRSLYRELSTMLPSPNGAPEEERRRDRRYLLETCEAAVRRVVLKPDMCARPARSLFRDVRHLFAVDAQADVWRVVEFHIEAGHRLADRMQQTLRRECPAVTRNGTPCQREPRPGQRYCPSHYGLAEDLQLEPQSAESRVGAGVG